MMTSPPPMRSPMNNPQAMGNYRMIGVPPPQSQSPSWSQSPRTTPSPLACHARSPVSQQPPPFSPPTPAPTPQLQKAPSPQGVCDDAHDPLQSLEKMVLLEPQSADFEGGVAQEMLQYGQGRSGGSGSPFPTYYNMDQNRLCTPPEAGNCYADAIRYGNAPPMQASTADRSDGRTAVPTTNQRDTLGLGVNGVVPGGFASLGPDVGCGASGVDSGSVSAAAQLGRGYGGGTAVQCPEDPTKRRRSSDSILCGRGQGLVGAGEESAESVARKRRRSLASLPETSVAQEMVGTAKPVGEATRAQPVKVEPETSGSEVDRDREPASEVSSAGADSAAASTSDTTSPVKRKRGRPFGAKNKVKEGGAVAAPKGRRKAEVHKQEVAAAVVAAKVRGPVAGPYVRVVGTRERPLSASVVNVAVRSTTEEEVRRKKAAAAGPRNPHGRRLAGLGHTSTLSPHYDAVTRDPTWMCAFCQRGSHHQGLGDLYGPYPGPAVLSSDSATVDLVAVPEESGRKLKGKRRKSDSVSGSEEPTRGTQLTRRSRQRKSSDAEREADPVAHSVPRELWVHEDCAAWTQGVYLGGHRVHGLQEAVWEATHMVCCKCKLTGATLGCIMRGCIEKYHYLCAVEKGCHLDPENFSVLCSKHKKSHSRPS